MNSIRILMTGAGVAALLLAGCERGGSGSVSGAAAVQQTKAAGQVSAGGGTSGEVLARTAKPQTDASYTGGTPFIAGGAGGNTGGTATGGTVEESGKGQAGSPVAPPPANAPRVEPVPK